MFDRIVDNMIEKSETAIPKNEDDYIGENGLLYCGKCHTKKQTEIEVFGTKRRPYCLCKCETEKRDAEEEARKHREFQERVKRMRQAGFPESDMVDWTFENDDMSNKPITEAMRKYVDNFKYFRKEGKGLLLYGSVGTGKTFAACEVANALVDKGYPVLVTNFARLINTMQERYDEKQKYIDSLNDFDLLVIDDLSTERDTSYMTEQVYNIVDSRYRSGLPMIITTNLSPTEIKNTSDISKQRIYDRILERCHPIQISGESRRRKKLKNDFLNTQHILGLDSQKGV